MTRRGDVTVLLEGLAGGDPSAMDALIPLVYEHLHTVAQNQMRRENAGHTLQPTALVHEAFLKLVDQNRAGWKNRTHFFSVASQIIRRILVDHARGKHRAKRGGEHARIQIDASLVAAYQRDVDLIMLDEALEQLAATSQQQSRIVQMRFFGGMTIKEIADAIDTSVSTVEREWRYARAWLYRRIGADEADPPQEQNHGRQAT